VRDNLAFPLRKPLVADARLLLPNAWQQDRGHDRHGKDMLKTARRAGLTADAKQENLARAGDGARKT